MTRPLEEEWAIQSAGHQTVFAREGIKALILISGGAAVALLALVGRAAGGGLSIDGYWIRLALVAFCVGVAAATATYLIAYLAQRDFTWLQTTPRGNRWGLAAIVLACVSLGAFLIGIMLSAFSISVVT